MAHDPDSAHLRGDYFEATLATLTGSAPGDPSDAGDLPGTLVAMLERVRDAIDTLLRDLASSHPSAWPILKYSSSVLPDDVVSLGRHRFQLQLASHVLGAVSIRLCFGTPPAAVDLEALQKKLEAIVDRVPAMRLGGTWDESKSKR